MNVINPARAGCFRRPGAKAIVAALQPTKGMVAISVSGTEHHDTLSPTSRNLEIKEWTNASTNTTRLPNPAILVLERLAARIENTVGRIR